MSIICSTDGMEKIDFSPDSNMTTDKKQQQQCQQRGNYADISKSCVCFYGVFFPQWCFVKRRHCRFCPCCCCCCARWLEQSLNSCGTNVARRTFDKYNRKVTTTATTTTTKATERKQKYGDCHLSHCHGQCHFYFQAE